MKINLIQKTNQCDSHPRVLKTLQLLGFAIVWH